MLTAAAELDANSVNTDPTRLRPPALPAVPAVTSYPRPLPEHQFEPSTVSHPDRCGYADPTTSSRVLNEVVVTGKEINELFQMYVLFSLSIISLSLLLFLLHPTTEVMLTVKFPRYFEQCSHFLPILSPYTTPNTYYSQSPFLFWSIINVACRSYSRNPTLLTALPKSVVEMAFLSGLSAAPPWYTIQALLLVLTWAIPTHAIANDTRFPLSGMMLHIALQYGIHIPMLSHEFPRNDLPSAPTETDMIRRSELWAHCMITYQSYVLSILLMLMLSEYRG